jgi:hypothetical protein
MKSKYNHMLPALAIICMLLTGSCKKILEIAPPGNTISTADAFGSNAKVASVMAGLYNGLNGYMSFSNGGTTLYASLSSDEIVNYGGPAKYQSYMLATNTITTVGDSTTSGIWTSAYQTIYNANGIIENLASSISSNITDSLRTQYTGEAKFVRAFSYFYLVNFYGDVPLVLTTNYTQTSLLARTSQSAIYAQIIQDLKDAQVALPDNYSAGLGERIRANKSTATALLARVYLYTNDYKDAEAQATTVISNLQFSLPADLTTVFLNNSNEVIWALKEDVSNIISGTGNATSDGVSFCPQILWSGLSASDQAFFLSDPSYYDLLSGTCLPKNYLDDQLVAAFEPGDKRWAAWVAISPTPTGPPYNGVTYYFPFKYTSADPGTSPASQYYVMFRLAEQYLIRAEARAQQNNASGAASDINVIRSRAGLTNTQAMSQTDLLTAIAQERRIEFFAEWGHRWLDLKRTGKAAAVLGTIPIKHPFKPTQLLYPIPVSEIIRDPRLVQNPGY